MSEDKIEVGEYVRTKKGQIDKFEKLVCYKNVKETSIVRCKEKKFWLEDIVKHSKNIIDLIEAEDCLIYKLKGSDWVRKGFVRKHIDARTNKEYLSVEFYSLDQLEILQIVTRKQLESVAYTV